MIMIAAAHFLFLGTALASLAFALAWTARILTRERYAVHPHTLATLYAATLAGPPLATTWLVVALFLPAWWLSEPAFDAAHASPLHDLHLLGGVLGEERERLLAVASVALLAVLAMALTAAGLRGRVAVWRMLDVLRDPGRPDSPDEEKLSDLTMLAARMHIGVHVLPASYPIAFVWGARRTTLILSSGIIRLLTRDQLRAVLAHEGAHHARRDNLGRLVLLICAYASLAMPISRRILTWYEEQTELVCDEIAARTTRAPLELASALVSIRRSTSARPSPAPAAMPMISSLAPSDRVSFEQRVRRLIAFSETSLAGRSGLTRSFWPLAHFCPACLRSHDGSRRARRSAGHPPRDRDLPPPVRVVNGHPARPGHCRIGIEPRGGRMPTRESGLHRQAEEPETIARTEFTPRIENFFEYEPLRAGKPSRFLIHLTDLSDGAPVAQAEVMLTIRSAGPGQPVGETTAKVGRVTGIYVAEVVTPAPGDYDIEFRVRNAHLNERMPLTGFRSE